MSIAPGGDFDIMNERIKELRRQATLVETYTANDGSVHEGKSVDLEKFAQLIVGECMEQVWYTREDGINGNVSQVIKDRIKQHFGVEE
jgi:hypothetical protein